MTREEAIEVLKKTLPYESDFAEARLVAIEALKEQENIIPLDGEDIMFVTTEEFEKIKAQEWIPVSKPPKKYGQYLVTLKSMYGFPRSVHIVAYGIIPGYRRKVGWRMYGGDYDTEITEDVLAWMPLPEPYREEGKV